MSTVIVPTATGTITITGDVHFYLGNGPEVLNALQVIMARQASLSSQLSTQGAAQMATIADVKAQADKIVAAVQSESDKDDAIITLVNGQTAMITSLKQQLADAVASGDPTALQAVLDSMTAAETSALANSAKVLAAVNANTPPATT